MNRCIRDPMGITPSVLQQVAECISDWTFSPWSDNRGQTTVVRQPWSDNRGQTTDSKPGNNADDGAIAASNLGRSGAPATPRDAVNAGARISTAAGDGNFYSSKDQQLLSQGRS
jgi:hypothetical protein